MTDAMIQWGVLLTSTSGMRLPVRSSKRPWYTDDRTEAIKVMKDKKKCSCYLTVEVLLKEEIEQALIEQELMQ